MGKNFLLSKTLWVNVIAIAAMAVQAFRAEWVIGPEYQASALAVVNMILRVITKEAIVW